MKSSKRRILHVIAALEGGGAERQLQILVNNTAPDKYRIAILFLHRGTDESVFDERINLLRISRGRKWNILSLWLRIYKTVMAYQPDILHLWLPEIVTIPSAFAGRLSGVPIVSSARGSMRSVNSFKQRIRDRVRYIQHLFADRIVANFHPDNEPLLFRKLFFRKKGCVISNAVTLRRAKIVAEGDLFIKKQGSFLIWYTGRIIPLKRLDLLLDSFVELWREGLDISLVICGSGTPKLLRQLKEKVRTNALEEHVIFLGYRDDWHSLAQNADLFVLPSTAEGMPNALFEAMLLGIPCISTDIPVVSNIVSHKNNIWMVEAGSRTSLTLGIREMYQSAPLRKQLAKAGQLHAKSFSIKEMTRAYDTLYQQL